jgi:hypothetical protein
MTVAADRTLNNAQDVGRRWPSSSMVPNILTEAEGVVCERITGPAASATVVLSRPAVAIRNVQSFVTATGVASVKEYLTQGTDFSVNLNNASLGGKASLTELLAVNYSAATWVVWYSPLGADGVGSQSSVTP